MKKKRTKILLIMIILIISSICFIKSKQKFVIEVFSNNVETIHESWNDRLYVPTMIKKEGDTYFIIDCWNSRILYSHVITNDISKWNTLTDKKYLGGHTVASDGQLYVFDNTDMQSLLVYIKDENGKFLLNQTIENIELRPHYVLYNENDHTFYVMGSMNGTLYKFTNNNGKLELLEKIILHELEQSYIRSISIIDNQLITVSGPSKIYTYNLSNFSIINQYDVPEQFFGMNQITKIDNTYFITVNTDKEGKTESTTILQTDDLSKLSLGEYTDLYKTMGFVGQPYFITYFDNHYWITEISADMGNGIKSFDFENGQVSNIETLFYWENVLQESTQRHETQKKLYAGKTVDLFIFAGQSNMSGKGNSIQAPEVKNGYEFRAISDPTKLYTIEEPFGKYENNSEAIDDTTDTGEYRKLRWISFCICKFLL